MLGKVVFRWGDIHRYVGGWQTLKRRSSIEFCQSETLQSKVPSFAWHHCSIKEGGLQTQAQ